MRGGLPRPRPALRALLAAAPGGPAARSAPPREVLPRAAPRPCVRRRRVCVLLAPLPAADGPPEPCASAARRRGARSPAQPAAARGSPRPLLCSPRSSGFLSVLCCFGGFWFFFLLRGRGGGGVPSVPPLPSRLGFPPPAPHWLAERAASPARSRGRLRAPHRPAPANWSPGSRGAAEAGAARAQPVGPESPPAARPAPVPSEPTEHGGGGGRGWWRLRAPAAGQRCGCGRPAASAEPGRRPPRPVSSPRARRAGPAAVGLRCPRPRGSLAASRPAPGVPAPRTCRQPGAPARGRGFDAGDGSGKLSWSWRLVGSCLVRAVSVDGSFSGVSLPLRGCV